jgi:hypothetical protein
LPQNSTSAGENHQDRTPTIFFEAISSLVTDAARQAGAGIGEAL